MENLAEKLTYIGERLEHCSSYDDAISTINMNNWIPKNSAHYTKLLSKVNKTYNKTTFAQDQGKINMKTSLDDMQCTNFLVERLGISKGSLSMLCATGCSGKTMLIQYLACCIASGKPFLDTFDVATGNVLHIDMEQSEVQTTKRYIRLAAGLGIQNKDINIERMTLKGKFDKPNTNMEELERELILVCKGFTFIVIDSLKAVSYADENSSEIENVVKMFKRVSEAANCAILLVHHKGKGKDAKQSGRGHSSIYDSVDLQLDLDYDRKNNIYTIECAKVRESSFFDGLSYTIEDTGGISLKHNCSYKLELKLLNNSIRNMTKTQQEIVLDTLSNGDKLGYNKLFQIVKGDRSAFRKTLDNMVLSNILVEEKGARNSMMYSLKESV